MANLVVKFLLINPNNLLGDDLKDESVVKYSAGSNSIKIILVTTDLTLKIRLLEKNGRESPEPPIIRLSFWR